MILVLFSSVLSVYTEEMDPNIGFLDNSLTQNAVIRRAKVGRSGLYMRAGGDGGSLVTFDYKNPYDSWSFEFKFKSLDLNWPQKSGIYFWYTKDRLVEGQFKGASGVFNGILVGIEFDGRYLKIVATTNDGTADFSGYDEVVLHTDHIDPERFVKTRNFHIKVIGTPRLLKLEIANEESTIYDKLKLFAEDFRERTSSGGYIGLTTQYSDVPHDKFFTLAQAKLSKRIESEHYDPHTSNSGKQPDFVPRRSHEVNHSAASVRNLISVQENSIQYIKKVLGRSKGLSLIDSLKKITDNVTLKRDSVNELNKAVVSFTEKVNSNTLEIINSRINAIDNKGAHITNRLSKIYANLRQLDSEYTRKSYNIYAFFIGIICLIILKNITLLTNNSK